MRSFFTSLCWMVTGIALILPGCKMKLNRSRSSEQSGETTQPPPPNPKVSGLASSAAVTRAAASVLPPARPKPSGPSYAVEPGLGLGPIRFGSTVATVERHMQAKCEELTDKICRYTSTGVELELKDGAVSGIVIHRFDRAVDGSPDKKWGMFAGGIPPKVMLTMVPDAVIEQLGKPTRTEEVTGAAPNWTVRRDYYDGMVLEYDKNLANNRLMLAQIRVVRRQNPPQ